MAKKQTAKQAYEEKSANVEKLLEKLQAGLKEHKQQFDKQDTRWDFVGDLFDAEYTLTRLTERFNKN